MAMSEYYMAFIMVFAVWFEVAIVAIRGIIRR
jgi:hypothetical protein